MSLQCSTCLEPITANCDSSVTPCGHAFHTECIKEWLNHQSNCPQCRKETTVNQLIKVFFSVSEEDVNKNAAADALKADLKCIELAEKNENLQKEVKKLETWCREFDDENGELVEENLRHKNEILELQRGYAIISKENEDNKNRFQKLKEEKQKLKTWYQVISNE